MQNDSVGKTVLVAGILCIFCSVLVSTSAVYLRPLQNENKQLDVQKKLLFLTGLIENEQVSKDVVVEAFKNVETKMVELQSGDFTEEIDALTFDQKKASKDSKLNKRIERKMDWGGNKFRSRFAPVYLIKVGGRVDQIVIPIHGKGLWSTLYGFLALDKNTVDVRGLSFYQHGETAGLGAEVDNPKWKAQWPGKKIYNQNFEPSIRIVKGGASGADPHKVDGLSGATITSNGVQGLVNYWVGPDGFGPFLAKYRGGTY